MCLYARLLILMELIDLVNSAIISSDLTQMINVPNPIPDCVSHFPALLNFFFLAQVFVFYNGFPSNGKYRSCCISFSFHHTDHPNQTILVLIGTVFVIISEMFHGRISLNSVLLLLLIMSRLRFELMYISS